MAQFERHEDNYDPDADRTDCGWLMWKAWGGREGIEWAQDKLEEFEQAREMGDTDFRHDCGGLTLTDIAQDSLEPWEHAFLEAHEKVAEADSNGHILGLFSESETPEFVKSRIRDAIRDGALFSSFDEIASGDLMELRETYADQLTDDTWTIDSLSETLEQQFGVDPDYADTQARTEVQAVLNRGREIGYEEQGFDDDEFYWSGSLGNRTTDTCKYLIAGTSADLERPEAFSGLDRPNGTNPFEGGTPMPKDELKEHIQTVARADPAFDTTPREWTPHIQCRKTFVRYVEGMAE
jgi:hypothetical protein